MKALAIGEAQRRFDDPRQIGYGEMRFLDAHRGAVPFQDARTQHLCRIGGGPMLLRGEVQQESNPSGNGATTLIPNTRRPPVAKAKKAK
jgi:hypothetical protein